MSNEKYLWKYSSSISPQQYIFSLAEMTRTLINVVVCSHWGQAWATRSGEIASSFEARLQTVDQGENLFVVRPWSTVHCTRHCTVHCTVTVHWLQHLSWALQTLQQPDKVTLQCCMPLIGTSHSYRPLIGQHVFFLFRIWWNYVLMQKATKTGSNFRKMTHGK